VVLVQGPEDIPSATGALRSGQAGPVGPGGEGAMTLAGPAAAPRRLAVVAEGAIRRATAADTPSRSASSMKPCGVGGVAHETVQHRPQH